MPSPPTSPAASSQAQSSKPLDYSKSDPSTKKPSPPARPSSSVLLISPQNTILLLHRVAQSSSFASAHVFPGGNLDDFHDGTTPDVGDVKRHEDSLSYRIAAIRETFEESGILLALKREAQSPGETHELLQLSNAELAEGRKLVHSKQIKFLEWLESKNGVPDTAPLIPFTRWVTPLNLPKRFSTQMYIYFLPLEADTAAPGTALAQSAQESTIPIPTHDGGIEHTAARFAPAHTWLDAARKGQIVLFPPQFFLLYLVSEFFTVSDPSTPRTKEILQQQRDKLKEFIYSSDPPWPEKVMSPIQQKMHHDGRSVLALDKPGKELEGTGRGGDKERVVLVEFTKGGPRRVEVAWRKDVLGETGDGLEKGRL